MQSQAAENSATDLAVVLVEAIKELAALQGPASEQSYIPWIIAFLAVLVSAVSLWINVSTVKKTLQHTTGSEFGKLLLQYRLDQVSALYGPMVMLNAESKATYSKLIEGKPEDWHFLHNVDEVRSNPTDMQLMEQILKANDEIARLLSSRGGLAYEAKVTESFKTFLRHHNLVKAAMSGKATLAIDDSDVFPKQFEADILEQYKKIREEIDWIVRNSESNMRKAFAS